ncbi:hypothetical protein ATK78_2597 [Pedobacter metabolipauper]|uniref:Uncharacterized protein n=1 Tax=Pedobacter metabolipauper TaxID=425513 RepID=A0A4R6SRV9_9SPHI|nr:hypothetical protein ATK78_2597 [Pedobacter metabolipauper]
MPVGNYPTGKTKLTFIKLSKPNSYEAYYKFTFGISFQVVKKPEFVVFFGILTLYVILIFRLS